MCVKSCLCNSCYKRDTCVACPYAENLKDVDCLAKGVIDCSNHVKRSETLDPLEKAIKEGYMPKNYHGIRNLINKIIKKDIP